jgi:hypothetical protein
LNKVYVDNYVICTSKPLSITLVYALGWLTETANDSVILREAGFLNFSQVIVILDP